MDTVTPQTVGATTSYPIPTASNHPYGMTVGSDGNIWFTEMGASSGAGKLVRMTTAGVFTTFSFSSFQCGGVTCYISPTGITSGPDGRLWFTSSGSAYIYGITTSGNSLTYTRYTLPAYTEALNGIVSGPGSKLWLTADNTSLEKGQIYSLTTTGTFTGYTNGSGHLCTNITEGSDGNLWCVEPNQNDLAKMTPTGSYVEYALPYNGSSFSYPQQVVPGNDGNLWVTDSQLDTSTLLKVTTAGVATQYTVPTSACCASAIAPDGASGFWLTDAGFASATLTGTVTQYSLGHNPDTAAGGAVIGPDGNFWFIDYTDNAIVKVTT